LGLGASGISADSGVWWSSVKLTLNWMDYTICYLLPKCSANARSRARQFHEKKHCTEHPLWLCLGESVPPEDLPGLVLAIDTNEMLALMHIDDEQEAARRLNQIAASQHGVSAKLTFRPAGGLGSLVEKHFGGRENELEMLWACLDEADKKGAGALIVGGRRTGKTSLRDRILFEITNKPEQRERICLVFNFEGKTPYGVGIALECWFFRLMKEAFADTDYPFEYEWSKAAKDSIHKRSEARSLVGKHLQNIKKTTDAVPLFLFDETENLVRWDTASAKERWSLFGLFRSLIQEGKLCLFATSYPHGLDSPYGLNVANKSSVNPVYNTFQSVELAAWSPDTTWDYLSSRLAGLGVVCPPHYRSELLAISRGIPWIVHAIGLHICEALPRGEKVVYPQTWHAVKTNVLDDIHENLKVSVTKLANDLDLENGSLDTDHQLGKGHLWRAFTILADQPSVTLTPEGSGWPDAIVFTRQQLEELLPKLHSSVIREALRRLSSSPVIEGLVKKEDQFVFANNLLPSWIRHTYG